MFWDGFEPPQFLATDQVDFIDWVARPTALESRDQIAESLYIEKEFSSSPRRHPTPRNQGSTPGSAHLRRPAGTHTR